MFSECLNIVESFYFIRDAMSPGFSLKILIRVVVGGFSSPVFRIISNPLESAFLFNDLIPSLLCCRVLPPYLVFWLTIISR